MTALRLALAAALAAGALTAAPAFADQTDNKAAATADMSGLHAFDSRGGRWVAHHRRLKTRSGGGQDWEEFDGTQQGWVLLGGLSNVDENLFHRPDGDVTGVTLRSYDPKTGEWAIWWLDTRNPDELDAPVKGRFVNGVGTFYSDDTLDGKPIKVRFVWSNMTRETGHWEQAFSFDGGKTWEVNWITDFRRPK
jgi:hypothetical protein